ncbi:hypothetical protein BDZ45DRAFT_677590 [Acephala macrosclerotiorum]|nr:hypothetical protein BDZ45DRAFT_677590 [Acephala macrosclerotiorum]
MPSKNQGSRSAPKTGRPSALSLQPTTRNPQTRSRSSINIKPPNHANLHTHLIKAAD